MLQNELLITRSYGYYRKKCIGGQKCTGRALTETSSGFREEVEGAEALPLAPDEDSPHEKPVDDDDDDEDADI